MGLIEKLKGLFSGGGHREADGPAPDDRDAGTSSAPDAPGGPGETPPAPPPPGTERPPEGQA